MKHAILSNFFVLEGLDGSGTTTQLKLLEERAAADGIPFRATCEPSDHFLGEQVRRVLKKERQVQPETLAHMFAADRSEHLYGEPDGICRSIEAGRIVLSDRYLFSSLAYQSLGCDFNLVAELNRRFPLPEIVFFIEVDPEECRRRMKKRSLEELFENISLQKKILSNYERGFALFRDSGMQLVRIDGTLSPEAIADTAFSSIAAARRDTSC